MAGDQVALMASLAHGTYAVVGHDRGARVALRLALDHPDLVSRLAILDTVPTEAMYAGVDQSRATRAWRYFFLSQPPDLPERLIGCMPGFYLKQTLHEWAGLEWKPETDALADYLHCFDREMIRATCEDYRAGATIDLEHDRADRDRRVACPLLVIWSARGVVAGFDVLAVWRDYADDLRGWTIDAGHFLAEERPAEVLSALTGFLS
jgi:haloacetate dehalogenase